MFCFLVKIKLRNLFYALMMNKPGFCCFVFFFFCHKKPEILTSQKYNVCNFNYGCGSSIYQLIFNCGWGFFVFILLKHDLLTDHQVLSSVALEGIISWAQILLNYVHLYPHMLHFLCISPYCHNISGCLCIPP